MAINTSNRRAACFGLALPFLQVMPAPDGGFDTRADRMHLNWLYPLPPAHRTAWRIRPTPVPEEIRAEMQRLNDILDDLKAEIDGLRGSH